MKEMIYKIKREFEILANGKYKDFEFAIISLGTHPCAYVKIPKGHKYYEVHYGNIPYIKCNGGLTFSEHQTFGESLGYWIGWDYTHCDDYNPIVAVSGYKWTTEEIFEEVKEVIKQL